MKTFAALLLSAVLPVTAWAQGLPKHIEVAVNVIKKTRLAATQEGPARATVASQIYLIDQLQESIKLGNSKPPDCHLLQDMIATVTDCDGYALVRTDVRIKDVIEEYPGFYPADSAFIAQLLVTDANNHYLMLTEGWAGLWSPSQLPDKLKDYSEERVELIPYLAMDDEYRRHASKIALPLRDDPRIGIVAYELEQKLRKTCGEMPGTDEGWDAWEACTERARNEAFKKASAKFKN